jgi:hypothetical protein
MLAITRKKGVAHKFASFSRRVVLSLAVQLAREVDRPGDLRQHG